jgi:thiamine-phosphate pyrophosphorylase
VSPLNKSQRVPLLCYVTDRRSLGGAEPGETRKALLQKIATAAAAGVDWIQIREKDLSGKECSSLTREALKLAANSARNAAARTANSAASATARPRIIVNDRLDVALAAQADGVHLGEKSLPPEEARRLVNSVRREKDFLIGVSCHSLAAARAAERDGADYLFFGPVFATPSKAAYSAPQGLDRLAEACRAVGVPALAIGGITWENAASCLSAGASGIAAIRLFQEAPDMTAIVQSLRNISA